MLQIPEISPLLSPSSPTVPPAYHLSRAQDKQKLWISAMSAFFARRREARPPQGDPFPSNLKITIKISSIWKRSKSHRIHSRPTQNEQSPISESWLLVRITIVRPEPGGFLWLISNYKGITWSRNRPTGIKSIESWLTGLNVCIASSLSTEQQRSLKTF